MTDADGDEAILTFNITVEEDLMPSFSGATISDQIYIANTAISDLVLPAATGGNGDLDYDILQRLPNGLTFNRDTRTVMGTPTAAMVRRMTYTLTVTDTDGDEATLTFTINVKSDLMPSLGGEIVPAQSYIVDTKIDDLMLPMATGGNDELTYTLMPELPTGLIFDTNTRTLSGTPTEIQSNMPYTWTATDTDGDEAMLTFTITVEEDLMPSLGGAIVADQSYIVDTKITDLMLPAATGGNGDLAYNLMTELPNGLTFNATTRIVSGTPTVSKGETEYTYTVTDADGDTDMLTFTITVEEDLMPSFTTTIPYQVYTAGMPIVALSLPAATGGNGNLDYDLSPSLPIGLTFSATTRTLSGTPTEIQSEMPYTWTATDTDGDEAMLVLNIRVVEAGAPVFDQMVDNQVYMQDVEISALTLPAATGGDGDLTYTLLPAELPTGLTFNDATRTLSGTPTRLQGATSYTWKVTDDDNDTDMLIFTIMVSPPTPPAPGTPAVAQEIVSGGGIGNADYTKGYAFTVDVSDSEFMDDDEISLLVDDIAQRDIRPASQIVGNAVNNTLTFMVARNSVQLGDVKTYSIVALATRTVSGISSTAKSSSLSLIVTRDVDEDDDGLIDIHFIEDLDNIRHNLAGTSYKTSASDRDNTAGATPGSLRGYELMRSLDFANSVSYASGEVNLDWRPTTGTGDTRTVVDATAAMNPGWQPIAHDTDITFNFQGTPFTAIFEGNGHTISNLFVKPPSDQRYLGLIGYIDSSGGVYNLGLVGVYVAGSGVLGSIIGGLVGENRGTITGCYATGQVLGNGTTGGLVGRNGGTITGCYATSSVSGLNEGASAIGGLVGQSGGTITGCYATGQVLGGTLTTGGLVGENLQEVSINASYAIGRVSSRHMRPFRIGGLVGLNSTASMINSCYWDMTVNESLSGIGSMTTDPRAMGLSTAEMQATSGTFPDFGSFTSAWQLTDGRYPRLKTWIGAGTDGIIGTDDDVYSNMLLGGQ